MEHVDNLVNSKRKSDQSHELERPQSQCSADIVGVKLIHEACVEVYPDQPTPNQITAVTKYWRGGPDPLDYISVFNNKGDKSKQIPAHWHYISFGLSDLHGDGRVHIRQRSRAEASGYGFELTFRLKKEHGENQPPTWPALLMQNLAKYVFNSDNMLQGGDHISWHESLDSGESRIQHMLMCEDAQLHEVQSVLGTITFIQIVGVTVEELKAAQHWNGPGVLELLKSSNTAGGEWLVTDMRRGESIFEIDPSFQDKLDHGIEKEGSNLSGVSGLIAWEEITHTRHDSTHDDNQHSHESRVSPQESEAIKSILQKGLRNGHSHAKLSRNQSTDSEGSDRPVELIRTRSLEGVHLYLNAETGSILPLALRGRLKHGRHFTFKSSINETAVTLVSPAIIGSIVDREHRFATRASWLQVLLDENFIDELSSQLEFLSDQNKIKLPERFSWPDKNLKISILPDDITPQLDNN